MKFEFQVRTGINNWISIFNIQKFNNSFNFRKEISRKLIVITKKTVLYLFLESWLKLKRIFESFIKFKIQRNNVISKRVRQIIHLLHAHPLYKKTKKPGTLTEWVMRRCALRINPAPGSKSCQVPSLFEPLKPLLTRTYEYLFSISPSEI